MKFNERFDRVIERKVVAGIDLSFDLLPKVCRQTELSSKTSAILVSPIVRVTPTLLGAPLTRPL